MRNRPDCVEAVIDQWWKEWHEEDYSWDGLARKKAAGFDSLQDYWSQTASLRYKSSENSVQDELVVVEGQKTYHVVHLPYIYEDGTPTVKTTDREYTEHRVAQVVELRERRLESEATRTNNEYLWFEGGVFPTIDLGDREWRKSLRVYFRRAFVTGRARFDSINLQDADFHSCLFRDWASFSKCAFTSIIFFSDTIFCDNADFILVHFYNICHFHSVDFYGDCNFIESPFEGDCVFDGSTFHGFSQFELTQYKRDVFFDGVAFDGRVSFERAKFSGKAKFETQFRNDASFEEAEFSAAVLFERTSFADVRFHRSSFRQEVKFLSVDFKGDGDFEAAKFEQAVSFEVCKFGQGPNFRLANFLGTSSFEVRWPQPAERLVSFEHAVFNHVAEFTGSEFRNFSAFRGAVFKNGIKLDAATETVAEFTFRAELENASTSSGPNLNDLEAGCRNLKQEMSRSSDKIREQLLHRFELIARRRQLKLSDPERWASWIYGTISNYGNSIWRPSIFLAGILLIFIVIYAPFTARLEFKLGCISHETCGFGSPKEWLQSSNLSISRMAPFGPYEGVGKEFAVKLAEADPGDAWLFRALATTQSLLALIGTFLLGLAFRRKFQIN